jgi:membrane protein DedA with SNARE-associated domain
MGSWLECLCGRRIHTNFFTGTNIYKLIKDADYDALEDPVDRHKLSGLFFGM